MPNVLLQAICRNCGAITAETDLTNSPAAQLYSGDHPDDLFGYPFVLQPCCGPTANPCIDVVFTIKEMKN
jgi:hypothetical protein